MEMEGVASAVLEVSDGPSWWRGFMCSLGHGRRMSGRWPGPISSNGSSMCMFSPSSSSGGPWGGPCGGGPWGGGGGGG